MAFNPLGAVLVASVTRDMADRRRAQQLTLVGGLVGQSPLGAVMVTALAAQAATAGSAAGGTGATGAGTTGAGTSGGTPGTGAVDVTSVDRVVIPELAGLDVRSARSSLTGLGLVTAVAGASAPDDVGTVVATEPAEATLVRTGSTVTLLVSVGSPVPDVLGVDVDKAAAAVKAAGFDAYVVGVDRWQGEPGVVLGQEPDGGTHLARGATVVLTAVQPRELESGETADEATPAVEVGKGARSPAKP